MSHANLIIAIDGPSGSGKSTLGKALAHRLSILYIDSGAVYRAAACKAIDSGIPIEVRAATISNREAVIAAARSADIRLGGDPDRQTVSLDGRDVTQRIRLADATRASSIVATIPEVRETVVEKLRRMSKTSGVVMDGRDIGTRVFPNAAVKLFLEASLPVRALRRSIEEHERGRDVTVEEVQHELEERDIRDTRREATPLIRASDAILIDTTDMTIEVLLKQALEIVEQHRID
ncbi:MAG: (d)CMP kinase [Blastocatellia bacterium AA13]|nr:MAG: (d)CMP kinase [Blastocatellia bacterium AA13]